MAVVDVTEMWSRSSGTLDSENGDLTSAKFVWTVGYQVLVDDPLDDVELILVATDLPKIGDLYKLDPFIWVVSQSPQQVSPIFWMVTIVYNGSPDPTDMRPKIAWSDSSSTEPIDQDFFGYPIVNVNGEPVDGLTKDLADNTLTITRNYSLFNPFLTSIYRDAVNSDTFAKYPPGTARLVGFSAQNAYRNADDTLGYWIVTATIQFRRGYRVPDAQAWWKRYRNEGLYERTGAIVTLTGGGGVGATAVANIKAGIIVSISVTSGGYGYTTAPTVTISVFGTGQTGSGAAATALIAFGRVIGVSVGVGGTLYTGGFVRAVDGDNNPVTRPVLLKRDGSREFQAQNAVWLVSPVHGSLPYATLGLL